MKGAMVLTVALVWCGIALAQAPPAQLTAGEKQFILDAAAGNMLEVQLGELAAKNAASEEVKKFAQRMVTDHGQANEQLRELAKKNNVDFPKELKPDQKKTMERLIGLKGAEFDREYASLMVSDHEQDVKRYQEQAKEAKNPDLKKYVETHIPILQNHLKQAQEMKGKLK